MNTKSSLVTKCINFFVELWLFVVSQLFSCTFRSDSDPSYCDHE